MEEKKICDNCHRELSLVEYYKCHNEEYYNTCKRCMRWRINDNKPDTFLPFLKDMDYPYIKEEWDSLNKKNQNAQMRSPTILGKYISKMRLMSFKRYTWKDSEELNERYNQLFIERSLNINPFAQRIGIYYVDLDWATYIAKTIEEEAGGTIERYSYGKNNIFIEFKDGSIIKFLPVSEAVHGQRFTKAYIQNKYLDKNKDFVYYAIYPCLTLGHEEPKCYIINEYEDLFKQYTEVRDYYYKLEYDADWYFEKAKNMLERAYEHKEILHDNH